MNLAVLHCQLFVAHHTSLHPLHGLVCLALLVSGLYPCFDHFVLEAQQVLLLVEEDVKLILVLLMAQRVLLQLLCQPRQLGLGPLLLVMMVLLHLLE